MTTGIWSRGADGRLKYNKELGDEINGALAGEPTTLKTIIGKRIKGPYHRIKEVDEEKNMGICCICGPVSIKLCGKYWRCHNAINRRDKDISLLRKYDISLEDFERMLVEQDYACPICKGKISLANGHVDHCHSSKVVRAILCRACNIGLGFFKDNPELLTNARKYLVERERGYTL